MAVMSRWSWRTRAFPTPHLPGGLGFKDFERVLEMATVPERVVSGFDELLEAALEVA